MTKSKYPPAACIFPTNVDCCSRPIRMKKYIGEKATGTIRIALRVPRSRCNWSKIYGQPVIQQGRDPSRAPRPNLSPALRDHGSWVSGSPIMPGMATSCSSSFSSSLARGIMVQSAQMMGWIALPGLKCCRSDSDVLRRS